MYGETPARVNKELQARVLNGKEPVSVRPAELIPPMWPDLEKKFPHLSDEEILIHAIFPHEAEGYFKEKLNAEGELTVSSRSRSSS